MPQIPAALAPRAGTWLGGCRPVLQLQHRPRLLVQLGAAVTGLVSEEAILVDVHHQELVELHVLVPLQGCAVAGPAQPLEVDAQTLGELRVGETERAAGRERDPGGPREQSRPGMRHGLTFPSFNCLTNVVLWCSTFSPFSVPLASI